MTFLDSPPDEPLFCECAYPRPHDGPLTWSGPLPCECLRCGLPVLGSVTASLAKGRAA